MKTIEKLTPGRFYDTRIQSVRRGPFGHDWVEYIVTTFAKPLWYTRLGVTVGVYHTDDKGDAISTASTIRNQENATS